MYLDPEKLRAKPLKRAQKAILLHTSGGPGCLNPGALASQTSGLLLRDLNAGTIIKIPSDFVHIPFKVATRSSSLTVTQTSARTRTRLATRGRADSPARHSMLKPRPKEPRVLRRGHLDHQAQVWQLLCPVSEVMGLPAGPPVTIRTTRKHQGVFVFLFPHVGLLELLLGGEVVGGLMS